MNTRRLGQTLLLTDKRTVFSLANNSMGKNQPTI